jgi:hypothetical protein
MAADVKSSLVQIAQNVLDIPFQAIRIVNADPSSGGATEVTADAILTEVELTNTKLDDVNASLNDIEAVIEVVNHGAATSAQRVAAQLGIGGVAVSDTVLVPTKSGLAIPLHDAIEYTPAATTDTYEFFVGGLAGTLVSTVLITFTDATKAVLQSVVRS